MGRGRIGPSLGIICEIMVADPTDDAEVDPLETFVENLTAWLIGPRHFNEVFDAQKPQAIFGDDYIGELYESRRFFVPILVDFFLFTGVS